MVNAILLHHIQADQLFYIIGQPTIVTVLVTPNRIIVSTVLQRAIHPRANGILTLYFSINGIPPLFHCGNWQFRSMVQDEQIAFMSVLVVTAQIIIHHYNPDGISFPTIYYVTGLSSTKSKLHLFEFFITVKHSMNFRSVS